MHTTTAIEAPARLGPATSPADHLRSELIDTADIVEEKRFRELRTELRDIGELAAKISQRGQLVPILVWLQRGKYVLLSGHRRVAALRMLSAPQIKAIVYGDRELCAKEAMDIAIDDNVDRNNFTKVELAALVASMVNEGMTQRQIGSRLRLSNGSVSDYFRLDAAPPDVRKAVEAGRIAVRAGLQLAKEVPATRTAILASSGGGMLSLGDVHRMASVAPAPTSNSPRNRAKRGAPWSRPNVIASGLAWQRNRVGEREVRIRIPEQLSDEQRVELRRVLLDQVRELRAPAP